MKIGQLRTNKPIEKAMKEIRDWLDKIGIDGMDLDTNYDAKKNIALIRFRYKLKDYEFKSTKQNKCRLNMWAIARVMESKVRADLMGIEEFSKSMMAYVQIGYTGDYEHKEEQSYQAEDKYYIRLGLSPLASNEETEKKYKSLVKSFHPDMALSDEAKKEFEKKMSEINEAYSEIKKERGACGTPAAKGSPCPR